MNPTWTAERTEKLKTLWAQGHSATVVAARLGGITRNAVIGKVHRMGLVLRGQSSGSRMARGPVSIRKPKRIKAAPVRSRRISEIMRAEIAEAAPLLAGDTPPPSAVTFADLEPQHCRWPYGDRPFKYCGCQKIEGLSYCAGHAARAFSVPSPQRKPADVMMAKARERETA